MFNYGVLKRWEVALRNCSSFFAERFKATVDYHAEGRVLSVQVIVKAKLSLAGNFNISS